MEPELDAVCAEQLLPCDDPGSPVSLFSFFLPLVLLSTIPPAGTNTSSNMGAFKELRILSMPYYVKMIRMEPPAFVYKIEFDEGLKIEFNEGLKI